MGTEAPSDQDDALLERLNALKQSNVSFNSKTSTPKLPSKSHQTAEDLLAQYQDLYGRLNSQGQDNLSSRVEDEPSSPTIEDLLAELGPEDQYNVDETHLQEANELITEANAALPERNPKSQLERHSNAKNEIVDRETPRSDLNEDVEADRTLEQILDEAKIGKERELSPPVSVPHLENPSPLPTNLPESFASLEFPPIPDTPLSANLPSVPTTAPSRVKAKVKPQGFSDEEIESWCIICCADANVICFGCDKDLYCWGCWREGHVGDEVGLEEKSHVWYVQSISSRCDRLQTQDGKIIVNGKQLLQGFYRRPILFRLRLIMNSFSGKK